MKTKKMAMGFITSLFCLQMFSLQAFAQQLPHESSKVCPNPGDWQPGYEFMYPSFCRPKEQRSTWLIDGAVKASSENSRYRLPKSDYKAVENFDLADLKTKTKYLAAISGFFLNGVMAQMPASAVNWPTEGSDFDRWEKHIQMAPHMDKDQWYWNYVAHPYAGAAYYSVCRENEFTRGECFFYAFMVSAIIWEYGFEAAKERPSIQDLIITPAAGALVGEIAIKLAGEIRENDGQVLGSKALGDIFLTLLDPLGGMISTLRKVVEPISDELNAQLYFGYGPARPPSYMPHYQNNLQYPGNRLSLTLKIPYQINWSGRVSVKVGH